MIIKLVDKPSREDSDDPNENYITETSMSREGIGGFQYWVQNIEKMKPGVDIVYLYDVKALHQKIGNGVNEDGSIKWEDDTIYYIRAAYKKLK